MLDNPRSRPSHQKMVTPAARREISLTFRSIGEQLPPPIIVRLWCVRLNGVLSPLLAKPCATSVVAQGEGAHRQAARWDTLINRKEAVPVPHLTQSLSVGGFVMTFKFAVGDRVTQAFSNHAEGKVIAVLKDRAGEYRYVVEMTGHRTIQIASEGSLVAAP
jgi:hypothetical protein